jgi:mercuric ion binding protein
MNRVFASLILVAAATPVWSATRTVTLSVPGMTCAACPITVKKALSRVAGVSKAEVYFEKRVATVTFDDTRSSVARLLQATGNAGYPAKLAGRAK